MSGDFISANAMTEPGTGSDLAAIKTTAHGMLVMGFAGQALAQWFPRKDLRQFQVRLAKMTFPGEALTVSGRITGEEEQNGEHLLIGEILVRNEAEEVIEREWESIFCRWRHHVDQQTGTYRGTDSNESLYGASQ